MHRTYSFHELRNAGLLLCLSCCIPASAFAAISADGTVGPASNLTGPNYTIAATLGTQVGSNLFHSFSVFNVNTGESATFTGPSNVSNIIARVTGGMISTIDGGLNSTIPQANLVLVNPSGIVFGPNASLNVGGSFYASTAHYVRLADGGTFDAMTPANSVLTTAPLAAFGFLGPTAPISVQGASLAVPDGKSLFLIGGDINMTGALTALGGTVNVASIASAGEATLTPELNVSTVTGFGTVSINGVMDTSESLVTPAGGGSIFIRGGQITVGSLSFIHSDTVVGNSGNIDIKAAGTLTVDGGSTDTTSTIQSLTNGAGSTGNILIDVGGLSLTNGGQIATGGQILGNYTGNAGNVQVVAAGTVLIDGADALGTHPSAIASSSLGGGSGGNINIFSDMLSVSNGGFISADTYGAGNAGAINLVANSMTLDNAQVYSDTYGTGNAGAVTLNANQLDVLNGSRISSNALAGSTGNGGNVGVNVTGNMTFNGGIITSTSEGMGLGGSINIHAGGAISMGGDAQITTSNLAWGDAGSIFITTPELNMNGGKISSVVDSWGGGMGGSINISVDRFIVANSGTVDATTLSSTASGQGGDVFINAATSVVLMSGARIQSNTGFAAPAGSIHIATPELNIDGGTIGSATSGRGSLAVGGLIDISADKVTVANAGMIDVGSYGQGQGGNLSLVANELNIDGGTISSRTIGMGDGGHLGINAGNTTLRNAGRIDASSSGPGRGGEVLLVADVLDINNGFISSDTSTGMDLWGTGAGGNVNINVANSITLRGGAQISSSSGGRGNAGNISINSGKTFTGENSSITTRALLSDGGNISLVAVDLIYLNNSDISATVSSGMGNGGNISIDPQFVVLNNSNVSANAFGGNGGNINLVANNFFQSANSTVTASSQLGVSGTVSLNTQVTDLSGSLADLPMVYLDTSGLSKQRCAAQLDGKISTFVLAGRGGIPQEPGGQLPSASLLSGISRQQTGSSMQQSGVSYASLSNPGVECAN